VLQSSVSRTGKKRNRFDLHEFLLKAKFNALELVSAVLFFRWLIHLLLKELR
jgi:hypothetical protein